MVYSLGADIGGTKIAAAIIDEKGNCSSRTEFPSITTDREAMFNQVVLCLEETLRKSGLSVHDLDGIGIGVAGKVDHKNGIALFQNNLPWTNFPLVQRIKKHFPIEEVMIDNDVYMAAFAEWVMHGKNPKDTFVYLTISTGISCCTIHNGDFVQGNGFAGEIGFLPVENNEPLGEFLRLESTASGPGIVKAAKHFMGSESADSMTTAKVIEAYKEGDSIATEVMSGTFSAYAKGIYAISCLLDPNVLVLGGGVVNHHPDLLEPIQDALKTYLVPDQTGLLNRMYVSQVHGDSGLIGAGLRIFDL